jgi:hypothetical protein
MELQELLQQLRTKGWGDTAIAERLGLDRITVYRWRMGLNEPHSARPVIRMLRELLRRPGPPRRKGAAGAGPATLSSSPVL